MEFQSTSYSIRHYETFHDEAVEITSHKICCCCLSTSKSYVSLQSCKHVGSIQIFDQLNLSKMTVCLLCHTMLVKIHVFLQQVIDSTNVLNKQLPQPSPSNLHNLKISDITTFSKTKFEFENDTEEETFLKIELEATNESALAFETEIKIEHHSSSDFENNLPLSEVKKENKKKKRVKSASCEEDKKYKGKIIVYNLSRDELEQERDKESKKESYLKLPFKCESCVKGFDHESTLKNHHEKQHSQKKGGIHCDICKTILGPLSYKEHARRHFRRYQFVICGKRSQDIFSISQHFNRQHGDAGQIRHEFQCADCEFSTNSNRSYRYHRDKHKLKQQCTVCGNTYVNATTLRVHMLNVHKQTTASYKCSTCDKAYSSKSGLHSHCASAHSAQRAYCAECRAHFRTKHGLAHHLMTHSRHLAKEDKRFTCDECDARFLKKSLLQAHIDWTHLKKVTHQCTKCNKVFKRAMTLKNHISFVHEKKRRPRDKICDYCGRGFTTISILRNHIRTHTGERPLVCSHCNATFAHSASLYTHTKLLHKR